MTFRGQPERARDPASCLRVGDVFPDLWAEGTQGSVALHSWVQGSYTVFFTHPSSYSSTAEIELLDLARHIAEFDALECKLMGMSQSDPLTERMWIEELSEKHGLAIPFPIISDEDGRIAEICGLREQNEALDRPVAKSFILGPDLRIRAIQECIHPVPRSAVELLRIVGILKSSRI
ncbi:redoxin domain-containing protein [Palleronia sp.]|uniref:redoxin domain-containing protein n=1 Tax=Palleronia sp. TaxID=1940284 RepID=UPI0035C7FC4C